MKQNIVKALGLAAALAGLTSAVGAQEAAKPSWNWGGDVRTRLDLKDQVKTPVDKGLKLRVRLGATGQLAEGKVTWGVGLATMPPGQKSVVSRNLTLAGGNLKGENAVGIDYAYLTFKPSTRVGVTAGKMKNPFWETDAIFDPDLTPEGLAVAVDVHQGAKGATVKNVTNALMWSPIFESAATTRDAFMLADQLKADLGPVKTALAAYFYGGLKTNAGADYIGKYTKDSMTTLSLKAAYALPIKKFPITVGVNLFDNVAVKAKSLGLEGRLDMSKVGPGALAITGRVVNNYATYKGWADDDFGPGPGHKGFRVEYTVPVWKVVNFKTSLFHSEPMKGSGISQHSRLFLDLSTKF